MVKRLDQVLVERGLVPSRQRAKELILQGQVLVKGHVQTKPSIKVQLDADIELLGQLLKYPSRAGLKLEKALEIFRIDVQGRVAIDVGASTGGFTSCLLQAGARRVYAVDVGQDQLVPELRADPRVWVFEKTNIRDLTPDKLPSLVDLATIDVSFISLTKVMPPVRPLLTSNAEVIALIKPQFETEGEGLNKHGVIVDPKVHFVHLPPLINRLQGDGLGLLNFACSPISGTKGNIEYLAHFKVGSPDIDASELVSDVIRTGWERKS